MSDYYQPDFYRFSQDSLELVRFVLLKVNSSCSLLDLGAGSGIIGIELARYLTPARLSLLEWQTDYEDYLRKNLSTFLPQETKADVHFRSFSEWTPPTSYDLIVCNPPYYLPGKGVPSPDPRRAGSRTFIKDGWGALMSCIEKSLSPQGRAFLVLKTEGTLLATVQAEIKTLKGTFHGKGDLTFLELAGLDVN